MILFDILVLHVPEVTPKNSKLHLAGWNGQDNPIDQFCDDTFNDWQSWQSKLNFEREYVVSLIQLAEADRWLLAGCYKRSGVEKTDHDKWRWKYDLKELEGALPVAGRLVVEFKRPGRAAYLDTDTWAHRLQVAELRDQRVSIEPFPGFHSVRISHSKLQTITRRGSPTWRGALSSVAGVYLITDTLTGKLYVGSATGGSGIWGRWCEYAENGHGGNKELGEVLQGEGAEYARHFQYAILEVADSQDDKAHVLEREGHWKRVLVSGKHGYNAN